MSRLTEHTVTQDATTPLRAKFNMQVELTDDHTKYSAQSALSESFLEQPDVIHNMTEGKLPTNIV